MGETFAANPATGTGSMSVPIAASPGRGGFGPQLSLSYDSAAGNGPFGLGWSLSLPSVTRKTEKGLPQYRDAIDSDIFILFGVEDLVPVLGPDGTRWHDDTTAPGFVIHRYRPRVEGLFARVERWSRIDSPADVHWRSISKDNVLTLYGDDADSRIADPQDASRIFSWLISESRDDKGNGIRYRYKKEDGDYQERPGQGDPFRQPHQRNRGPASDPRRGAQRYLHRVLYGNVKPLLDTQGRRPRFLSDLADPPGDTGADWLFELRFDYGELDEGNPMGEPERPWRYRLDAFSRYRSGFEVRTCRRCERVLMVHHIPDSPASPGRPAQPGYEGVVRSTDFVYDDAIDPVLADGPIHCFLKQARQTGWRQEGAVITRRSLPPVAFGYSEAIVQDAVEDVDPRSLQNLPMGLDGTMYRWIDLHGEGVPGILAVQADAWFYKRNWSPIPTALPGGGEVMRAAFAPLETVALKPKAALGGRVQIMDLAGNGRPGVVVMEGALPGLYEHDEADGWRPFRPFTSRLNRDLRDANLRFIDLDGDGRADVLITEDEALVWHASLAEEGFGPARCAARALDEEKGPRIVFADGTQSIYLADLSGDGLTDIVRLRNGEICYWPNLGYGRFGAKIEMDNAPWFDNPEQFDHKRIRLADIDGSGTTDIIYLHRDGVRLYFNQSGNGWSQARILKVFPRLDDLASVVAIDLLGNGTACLAWSSALPGDARRAMRYVNLMGGDKPHLLVRVINNLGAEARIHYAPSTKFYLQDKRDGKPWITRLPFPVHVVERVETWDHVGRNRFVSRYAYHHGCFDGEEREFRGFGMVEQWDTEAFATLAAGAAPTANVDAVSHVPPVYTKTWFHTGVHLGGECVSRHFEGEYFREPGLDGESARLLLLDDTSLPPDLSLAEAREACRALRGSMLRREVYALDNVGSSAEYPSGIPYTVTEQSLAVRLLQRRGANRHAVFLTHAREAITYYYERNPADPRVQHALTLEVDDFGNVLKQAAVAYGRRRQIPIRGPGGATEWRLNPGLAGLDEADKARQTTALLTYTENRFTRDPAGGGDAIERDDDYRAPLPCESMTFELTGYMASGPPMEPAVDPALAARRYQALDLVRLQVDPPDPGGRPRYAHIFNAPEVEYEGVATDERRRRRIKWQRTRYRRDDLGGLLPLGELQPLALPGESYRLAFTPGLLDQVFQRPRAGLAPEILLVGPTRARVLGGQGADQGGFVDLDGDGHWWIPSGLSFYHPADVAPHIELAEAQAHFYLPRRYRDPFGQSSVVDFDGHDLLMVESRDPLDNRVTVDANDYRVLQPRRLSDPNRNQAEVVFDVLGMVVGTAVMGKPTDNPRQGDWLDERFSSEPPQALLDAFVDRPREISADTNASVASQAAHDLLANATTRIVYDLTRYMRLGEPPFAATIARETHVSDLPQGRLSKLQISFSYSDGFGREIQKKVQAGPGPLDDVDPDSPIVKSRWICSGWTIFNNKGKALRQYEPFFSKRQQADGSFHSDHHFEFGVQAGVSSVLFYDPAERVVATLHPDHSWEKVVFGPWQQTTYDVNDTVLFPVRADNPLRDDIVASHFSRLPDADYLPTWHELRTVPAHAAAFANRYPNAEDRHHETKAAKRAAGHADTPASAHLDVLGRPFLYVARNRVDCQGHLLHGRTEACLSRVELDIEGNLRQMYDERRLPDAHNLPLGPLDSRVILREVQDMLGNRIYRLSMEAGARWMLNDVRGKLIRQWDDRGHHLTMKYDALRRPIEKYVRGTDSDPDPRKTTSDPRTLNPPNQAGLLVERIEYGEPPPGVSAAQEAAVLRVNLRTRIMRHFDSAGVLIHGRPDASGLLMEAYDFKGNLRCSTRKLVRDYKAIADWSGAPGPALETEAFQGSTRYDALNRPVQSVAPRSSLERGKFSIVQTVFNEANLLERVDVWLEQAAEPTVLLDPADHPPSQVGVANIDYDAKGRRTLIDYRCAGMDATVIRSCYAYDRETGRLAHRYTRRGVDPVSAQGVDFSGDCDNAEPPPATIAAPRTPPLGAGCGLQNLYYTYDPAGNITHIRDAAQQTIYFSNQCIEASNDYVYDARYRLIQAEGREHLGQAGQPLAHSYNDAGRVGMPGAGPGGGFAPDDRAAMGRYTERYVYDAVGNLLLMQHARGNTAVADWTRRYAYADASLIEPGKTSNRLSGTVVGNAPDAFYDHDAHGNMLGMPHLRTLQWDYQDRLLMTQRQALNEQDGDGALRQAERTWYLYDASGQRVRKVTELADNGGIKDEHIYQGEFEVYRLYQGGPEARQLKRERETLHVMDDVLRVALVETRTLGSEQGVPRRLVRYQLATSLGSSSLELDGLARIISYEEYSPYGGSTYQAVRSLAEAAKRYRYTGKERDEESGLYYHGARYYACWLGRWTRCDPAEIADGPNAYVYARCNPIRYSDPSGNTSAEEEGARRNAARRDNGALTADQIGDIYKSVDDVPKYFDTPQRPSASRIEEQHNRLLQGESKRAQQQADREKAPKLSLAQKREMRTAAANAGAQNAAVESAESLVKLSKVLALPMIGPLVLTMPSATFEGAKAPMPAATGDSVQDAILADYYGVGETATDTTLLALSFLPLGEIAQGAKLAGGKLPVPTNSLSSLGGSGFISFSERWAQAKPKTYITYIFTDAPGSIRYVGRASGTGSAEDVLYQRLTKGHHIFDANPELIADVLAEHPSREASMGAESVYKDYYEQLGHKLLNDPKSPPLSTVGRKLEKTRQRISHFFQSW
ncbi:SpvB/TcaC N-terminal domain-containing protein [Bordetella hinzii]|uniref:SpvB/TcaC N-terminal domain-containing protein n=1 Tax=Bordetella hinzii TaxID=103855 RepID=UPI0039FD15EA